MNAGFNFILLSLVCFSCLPDSLTKYKEDPPTNTTSSSQGGTNPNNPGNTPRSMAAPAGLSVNRSVLLNVPSASAFRVLDYISTEGEDGAVGLITAIYRGSSWSPAGTYHSVTLGGTGENYDWLEVRLISGSFNSLDDLDHTAPFQAAKTYILNNGVRYFNAALNVSNATAPGGVHNGFHVSTAASSISRITGDISQGSGNIVHSIVETGGTLNRQMVFVATHEGNFSSLDTLIGISSNSTSYSATVNAVKSNSVRVNIPTPPPLHLSGANITSDNGDGDATDMDDFVGVINVVEGNNAIVNVVKGQVTVDGATSFLYQNPWTSTGSVSAADAATDRTFQGFVGEEFSLISQFEIPDNLSDAEVQNFLGSLTYTLQVRNVGGGWSDTEPPAGLTITDGNLTGTPTRALERRAYRLLVRNNAGEATTEFFLQVSNYYEIKAESATDIAADSYILHRMGQGHNRTSCRILKQHIVDPANPQNVSPHGYDIGCILDAPEQDFFEKGLKITVNFGKDICQHTTHRPFTFYRYPVNTTVADASGSDVASTLINNVGDIAHASCQGLYVTDFGGTNGKVAIPASEPSVTTGGDTTLSAPWNVANISNPHPWGRLLAIGLKEAPGWVSDGDPPADYCHGDLSKNPIYSSLDEKYVPDSCDRGNVRIMTRTWAFTEGVGCAYGTELSGVHDCGGTPGACMDGAGRALIGADDIDYDDDSLSARATILSTANNDADFNEVVFNYSTSRERDLFTNRYLTNFPENSQCANADGYNFEFVTYRSNTDHMSIDNVGAFRQASSLYTFSCRDGAREILARIRLLVREWDRDFRASDAIDRINPDAALATRFMDSGQEFSPQNIYYNHLGDWDNSYSSPDALRGNITGLILMTTDPTWINCSTPSSAVYPLPYNGL